MVSLLSSRRRLLKNCYLFIFGGSIASLLTKDSSVIVQTQFFSRKFPARKFFSLTEFWLAHPTKNCPESDRQDRPDLFKAIERVSLELSEDGYSVKAIHRYRNLDAFYDHLHFLKQKYEYETNGNFKKGYLSVISEDLVTSEVISYQETPTICSLS